MVLTAEQRQRDETTFSVHVHSFEIPCVQGPYVRLFFSKSVSGTTLVPSVSPFTRPPNAISSTNSCFGLPAPLCFVLLASYVSQLELFHLSWTEASPNQKAFQAVGGIVHYSPSYFDTE